MMGFAKATVWTLAPTEDAASIAMVSYFSGKLLHQHIVDSVVSPDCCRMLSLLDVSVYFQCVAVATIDCFGWSCSEQVYVTQETEVILVPTSSRVLQPVSQDYFEVGMEYLSLTHVWSHKEICS